MFNKFKHIKNEKGLTLIELLAVIVILAIIAAIAVPAIGNIISNSRDKAILSEAVNVLSGAKIAHTEGVCKATVETPASIDDAGIGTLPEGCKGKVLEAYVDGLKLGNDTEVTLEGEKWNIKFEKFKDIKAEKFKVKDKGYKISEEDLNNLLDGNK